MMEDAAPSPADIRQVYWLEALPNGRILRSGMCQPQVTHLFTPIDPEASLVWYLSDPGVGDEFDAFHLASDGPTRRKLPPVVVSKTDIMADDGDEATLSNIPEGALVTVDGTQIGGLEDGTLVLTSAMPATYQIRISSWPFLPFEVEIIAR